MAGATHVYWAVKRWLSLRKKGFEHVPEGEWMKIFAQHILPAYTGKERFYHGLKHLRNAISAADKIIKAHPEKDMVDPIAVELGIWFHDIVNDAQRRDNEEKSAQRFLQLIGADIYENKKRRDVIYSILATSHDRRPTKENAKIVCDADLHTLASDKKQIAEEVAQIRKEYPHKSDEEFHNGRRTRLTRIADREGGIFCTAPARKFWEKKAQANIHKLWER